MSILILDFCFDKDKLLIYKKLVRYYYDINKKKRPYLALMLIENCMKFKTVKGFREEIEFIDKLTIFLKAIYKYIIQKKESVCIWNMNERVGKLK